MKDIADNRLFAQILSFALPALFAISAMWGNAWHDAYRMNPDEGINLAKAALVAAGYPLFTEVWSDQPPVLTYVLGALQSVAPNDVGAARLVVLGFSCGLLFSLFRIVSRGAGNYAAVFATALLGLSALFAKLSVSVMIGLPAIAFAVMALDAATFPWRRPLVGSILGGILFALGLQTKLFVFVALPALLLAVYLQPAGLRSERVKQTALTAVSVVAVFLAVLVLAGQPLVAQQIQPHLNTTLRENAHTAPLAALRTYIVQWPMPFAAALLALPVVFLRRVRSAIVPLVWLGCGTAALLMHAPVWNHHLPLLMVPGAWLAGIGFGTLCEMLSGTPRARWIGIAGVAVFMAIFIWSASVWRPIHGSGNSKDLAALEALKAYGQPGDIVLTDMPLDAFRAGRLAVPELAVFSMKRISGGGLTSDDVMAAFRRHAVTQVMFRRFQAPAPLLMELNQQFVPIFNAYNWPHFVAPAAMPK